VQQAMQLQQQTRVFQPQLPDVAAALSDLNKIAAGKAKPSPELVQQVRQHEDVLVPTGESTDLYSSDIDRDRPCHWQ
jgi:hypothetical protein